MIGQAAQKLFEVPSVVVRVLDPARAEFYAERGLRSSARPRPRSTTLIDAVRAYEAAT